MSPFALLLLSADAQAYLYGGNPEMEFRVDRSAGDLLEGSVVLDRVRALRCDGGTQDYTVNQTIDPVLGYALAIQGGDLCALRLYWSSSLTLEGDGAYGPFTVVHDEPYTTVTIDPSISPVPLTPFEVTSGQMTPGAPRLLLTIE